MTNTDKLRQEIDEVLKECDGLGGALALHLLDATVLYGLLQQARDALPVWVPVGERLPEPYVDVWFRVKRHSELCLGFRDQDGNCWFDKLNTDRDGDPSDEYDTICWMAKDALPPPPETD